MLSPIFLKKPLKHIRGDKRHLGMRYLASTQSDIIIRTLNFTLDFFSERIGFKTKTISFKIFSPWEFINHTKYSSVRI